MEHIDYRTFRRLCSENARDTQYPSQAETYLSEQCIRFYKTFLICAKLLNEMPSHNILSVGAGSAYVEIQLKRFFNANVTIIDFQEMIKLNKEYYQKYGFESYPMDLSQGEVLDTSKKFDLIMSCEVLEHLPIAPYNHIRSLAGSLHPSGRLLLTTPNFARLSLRVKMLLGLPILTEPERAFAAVSFKNEGIHRREYVEKEIVDAMTRNKIRHVATYFSRNTEKYNLKEFAFDIVPALFKPTMILVGKNADDE